LYSNGSNRAGLKGTYLLFTFIAFILLVPPAFGQGVTQSHESIQDAQDDAEYSAMEIKTISLTVMEEMIDWASEQVQGFSEPVFIDGTPFLSQWTSDGSILMMDGDTGSGEVSGAPSSRATWDQKYDGTYCDIYVDTETANPSQSSINTLGSTFDNTIYPIDNEIFDPDDSVSTIDIAIYNFGDGPGGVGGYFSPMNPDTVFVDSSDMFWADEILAHEFQHLLHNDEDPWEELWLDEGCADYAISQCFGYNAGSLNSHINAFENHPDNELTEWDGQIYDYGTSFAFITYLSEHYGGNNFISQLVDSRQHGTTSVTNVLNANGYTDTFEDVFKKWAVANWLDDTSIASGQFGYYNLSIQVDTSAQHSSYPIQSASGSVKEWAADYISFSGGSEDILISFDGDDSDSFLAMVILKGSGTASAVGEITLDGSQKGTFAGSGFGSSYSPILLVPISINGQGSYSYSVEEGDMTPPVTTSIVSPSTPNGNKGWYSTTPKITLNTEGGATTFYRWDTQSWSLYTQKLSAPEGEHTLWFYSVDDSNNEEEHQVLNFKVDTTPATTAVSINPSTPDGEDGWYLQVPTITLSAPGESPPANISYAWDDEEYHTYGASFKAMEGNHTLNFFSTDSVGNQEDERSMFIKVDTEVPGSDMVLDQPDPDGQNGWYVSNTSVSFVSLIDGDEVDFFYYFDSGAPMKAEGGVLLIEGVHTLIYYAKDPAGNMEAANSFDFKLDLSHPVTNLTITEPQESGWYSDLPTIDISTEDGSTVRYRWDEEKYSQDSSFSSSEDFEAREGVHTLYLSAMDEAGNMEEEWSISLKVDTISPTITINIVPPTPSQTGWYHDSPKVTLTPSEKDVTIFYSMNSEPFVRYKGPFFVQEGVSMLTAYAIDVAGNGGVVDAARLEIKVDLDDPLASLTADKTSIRILEEFTLFAHDSFDLGGIVKYTFIISNGDEYSEEDGLSPGDGSFNGDTSMSFDSSGTYEIFVEVTDSSGRKSESNSVFITVREKESMFEAGGFTSFDSGSGFWFIMAIIILIIVCILAVAIALHKKRSYEVLEAEIVEDEDNYHGYEPQDDLGYYDDHEEGPMVLDDSIFEVTDDGGPSHEVLPHVELGRRDARSHLLTDKKILLISESSQSKASKKRAGEDDTGDWL